MEDEREFEEWARRWLGDRDVPADLRAMAAIQRSRPAGADPLADLDLRVFGPGSGHPVFDEEANRAANAEWAQVLSHLFPVVETRDQGVLGYWLHPGERAAAPPVVGVDGEGGFFVAAGGTLAEAVVAHHCGGRDDEFADLAERFAAAGIPITARSHADLPEPFIVVDPEELEARLDEVARRRTGG